MIRISVTFTSLSRLHESVPTNRTLSSTDPLSVLCENVAIGFKTGIEAYFVGKNSAI